MTREELQVVVAGGGIGGLTVGLLLARSGAAVTIVDRRAHDDARGAGLLLQPNGLAVLRALELEDTLERSGHRLDVASLSGADGRPISRLQMPDFGAGLDHVLCVRRHSLLSALETAVASHPRASLRSGDVIGGSTDGSITIDRDGNPEVLRADLVVGADGVGSVVRASGAFGADARGAGRWYVRGLVPFDASSSVAAELSGEHWTRLGVFGGAPVGGGLFYFYCSADAPTVKAALTARDFSAFAQTWSAALPATTGVLDRLTSTDALLVNQAHHVACDRWVDGRLVLLGDAAHAMEPTLGQGANSALVDGAVLCLELGREDDLAVALRRYEQRRQRRVTAVQRSAERIARLANVRRDMSRTARDVGLRVLSRKPLLARQARAAQQEPPAELFHLLARQLAVTRGSSTSHSRPPTS